MKNDPFGNLRDWGPVLNALSNLTDNGDISQCQPGLIRILRYKGNWRLREEVLKRVGKVQSPSKDLVDQVIAILDDDNIYYDARIIAGNALIHLFENMEDKGEADIHDKARKVIKKLKRTPQPPIFDKAIDRLSSTLGLA